MLASDVIAPFVDSECASDLHLIPEKDITYRMCVGSRELNNDTKKDIHPMIHIDDCRDSLESTNM